MRSLVNSTNHEGHLVDAVPARLGYSPEATDYIDARVLAANTSEAHAIPAGARHVNFVANGDFYAKFAANTGTIAIPSGDITDGSSPSLNTGIRLIPDGIGFILLIAPAATIVTLEFWS